MTDADEPTPDLYMAEASIDDVNKLLTDLYATSRLGRSRLVDAIDKLDERTARALLARQVGAYVVGTLTESERKTWYHE